jgi:hypothetical protein
MSSQTARDVRYSAPVQKAAAAAGIVFLLVGVLGFIPVNSADDILHLVLAIGMVGLGLALGRRSRVV